MAGAVPVMDANDRWPQMNDDFRPCFRFAPSPNGFLHLGHAYSALAGLYNQQKKFAESAKINARAAELGEGGGNAAAVLNQGISHWNAGQYPEAKAQFERATKLDPTLADAFYRLGMANVNLGELPAAVTAFEEYRKLAPTGEHAEITKGILKSIKGTTAHVM